MLIHSKFVGIFVDGPKGSMTSQMAYGKQIYGLIPVFQTKTTRCQITMSIGLAAKISNIMAEEHQLKISIVKLPCINIDLFIYLFIYCHLYSAFSKVQCSNALYRL